MWGQAFLGRFVIRALCVWGILLNESVSQWLLMGVCVAHKPGVCVQITRERNRVKFS